MTGSDEADIRLILASPLFDPDFYKHQVDAPFASPEDAARHYLGPGWLAELSPSSGFDGSYYLDANGDVRAAGLNPLLHYLQFGRNEGRRPVISRAPLAARSFPPESEEAWGRLRTLRAAATAEADSQGQEGVDIVVIADRDSDHILNCLYAVLSAPNRTPFRIVVATTGLCPEFAPRLVALAQAGLVTILEAKGLVERVDVTEHDFSLGPNRDIVLLSPWVLVHGDWLDRLRWHATACDFAATVTPFSNNAAIFSYPFLTHNNRQSLEIEPPALDDLFARVNRHSSAEVPTAADCCTYITRRSLNAIGRFEFRGFSQGSEAIADFSERAAAGGWRNLAALDVFVRNTAPKSVRLPALPHALEPKSRLTLLYAAHQERVLRFVKRDPLRTGREKVDITRFASWSGGRGILMVSHDWGGGLERHVRELAALVSEDGVPVLIWRPGSARDGLAFHPGGAVDFPNLPMVSWARIRDSGALLKSLNLRRVHLHSLVGIPVECLTHLIEAIQEAGLEYDFSFHDYAAVCPRVNMIDWSGVYCDSPSPNYCQECVNREGSPFGWQDVHKWRDRYRTLLIEARRLYAPSEDVIRRLGRYLPERADILLRPYPVKELLVPRPLPAPRRPAVRTVGVIGSIGSHKGARVIQAMAADALIRELPLRFVIYGSVDNPVLAQHPNVTVTGPYREEEIDSLLAADPCEVAFFASVCPETFCYTLDHALRNAVFPVAFDVGAVAERIRAIGFGAVLSLESSTDSAFLNDFFLRGVPPLPDLVPEESRRWQGAGRFFDDLDQDRAELA